MKAYKVFNPDWTCRGFEYKVGETYELDGSPEICEKGFHFCKKLIDCFNYYDFNPGNKVAEVEVLGEIDFDSDQIKGCTNQIKIVRELTWEEVLRLVNTGFGNSGRGNTGHRNSGDWNSGDWNSGDLNTGHRNSGSRNSGNWNSGDLNTGSWNSGDLNTGSWNSGSRNSGDWNSGDLNTGDWNSGDWNMGCFNTCVGKLTFFNQPSTWTAGTWMRSKAKRILHTMPGQLIVKSDQLIKRGNDELKARRQAWWDKLSKAAKTEIKRLPNFDPAIFKEITMIDVEERQDELS